ncbi:MAG: hypothetical protein WCF84_15345 [Anaerolineae bacterium]
MSSPNSVTPRKPVAVPLERLSLLISLFLVGLTLSLLIDLPTRPFEFTFLGSRATLVLSGAWLFGLLLAALSAAGVESIMRSHPHVLMSETQYTAILWVLPCLIAMAAALIIPGIPGSRLYALVGIGIAGALMALVILGEYYTIDFYDSLYSFARLGLNLATYLTALLIFITVYGFRVRSILSAPLISILAGLLALELLRGSEADVRRTWLYAAATGLAMGEAIWAINYWAVSTLVGSVTLLLIFYVITGIFQQHLWGRLRWRILIEFAVVIAAAALLLWRRG